MLWKEENNRFLYTQWQELSSFPENSKQNILLKSSLDNKSEFTGPNRLILNRSARKSKNSHKRQPSENFKFSYNQTTHETQNLSQMQAPHKMDKINRKIDQEEIVQNTVLEYGSKVKLKKRSSLKGNFQHIKTQMSKDLIVIDQQFQEKKTEKRIPHRRKCRILTKKQYQREYQKYMAKKQKQQVQNIFRQVNRQMKSSQNQKLGDNFYQGIRKDALQKIDYMSYNQKYYDNQEVAHLQSVVDNCNKLIHKRVCKIDAVPLYRTIKKSQVKSKKSTAMDEVQQKNEDYIKSVRTCNEGIQLRKSSINSNNFSVKQIGSYDKNQNKITDKKGSKRPISRVKSSRPGSNAKDQQLNDKFKQILRDCSHEQNNMKQLKTGMKIFQFYCKQLESGFATKGVKIGNYIKMMYS